MSNYACDYARFVGQSEPKRPLRLRASRPLDVRYLILVFNISRTTTDPNPTVTERLLILSGTQKHTVPSTPQKTPQI